MPDNSAAGTPAERRDERDGVTRGSGGGAGGSTQREGAGGRAATDPRPGAPMPGRSVSADDPGPAPRESAARDAGRREGVMGGGRDTTTGARDGLLGGRDTAERDGAPARDGTRGPAGSAGPGEHEGDSVSGRGGAGGSGNRLMARDEGDKWGLRLQHAVAGFVDGPRGSVEEADRVLQEVSERFTHAVDQRRRTLRTSWQAAGDDTADTEQLRLALRDYRELAERLLRM